MLPTESALGRPYGGDDARFGNLIGPWFAAMSRRAVLGRSCCSHCWHGYRRGEVIADQVATDYIANVLDLADGAPAPLFDESVPDEERPFLVTLGDGAPDPAALSRLVRELLPTSECSPHYVLRVGSHPVLMPHSLPRAVPPMGRGPSSGDAGNGVTIGVVDTGHYPDHPWWGGKVSGDPEGPPGHELEIQRGHGTFVVGILRRLAPGADIVVDGVPPGPELTEQLVADAILRSARRGAQVINVSLGLCPIEGLPPFALATAVRAVEREFADGVVIVAAAGNDASDHPRFPAAFPLVVGVGATDNRGRRAPYSNYGWWVDACARGNWRSSFFGAPGAGELFIPVLDDTFRGFARWTGSSFAAPVVAARIARDVAAGGSTALLTSLAVRGGSRRVPLLGAYVE